MTHATLESVIGNTVYDSAGDKIGKVKQIYLDNASGAPTWAAVSTGMFSGDSMVPLAGAQHHPDDGTLRVGVDKEHVKSAPHLDEGGHITRSAEQELFSHYGINPQQAGWDAYGRQQIRPGPDAPMTHGREGQMSEGQMAQGQMSQGREGQMTQGRGESSDRGSGEESMIRSEERLEVGTQREEAGTARLRKYVVTENQTVEVPTTHEEVRVEREPITDPSQVRSPEMGEQEQEVTLHEDRVTVQKESVPVERARLTVDEVAENRTVSDTVRKEQFDTEGTGTARTEGTEERSRSDTDDR